jgi:hypothetical protein
MSLTNPVVLSQAESYDSTGAIIKQDITVAPLNPLSTGGAGVKTYELSLSFNKTVASTGDSNDAVLKLSANNYSASDTNFILRGINSGINNRSGGTLGMLDNSIGCQGKSGGTARIITGLHVIPENYGSVTDEFGGIRVQLKNEGAVATSEYCILVENLNNSLATKVTDALKVQDSGANTGFTTGLNLNGATLTNEIVLSDGKKITVSGDKVVITSSDSSESLTLDLSTAGTNYLHLTGGGQPLPGKPV